MYISKIKILFLLLGLNISVVGFAAGQSNVTFSRDKKGFTLCNGYVYLKFDSDSCTINQLKFDKTGEANYGPNIAFCQEDGLAGVCVELSTPDGECKLSRGKEFKIITEKLSPEEASIIIKNLQTMNPSGNVLTTENWQLILEKGAKEFAILRNEKYLRETIVNWDRLSLLVDERVACVKKSNVQCPMSNVNGQPVFCFIGPETFKNDTSVVFGIPAEEGTSTFAYGHPEYPSVFLDVSGKDIVKVGYQLGNWQGGPHITLNAFFIGGEPETPGPIQNLGQTPIGEFNDYTAADKKIEAGARFSTKIKIGFYPHPSPPELFPQCKLTGPFAEKLTLALNNAYAVNFLYTYQPWIRKGFVMNAGRFGNYWDPDGGPFTLGAVAFGDPWEIDYMVDNTYMFVSYQTSEGDLPRVINAKKTFEGEVNYASFWSRKDTLAPEAMLILQVYYTACYLPNQQRKEFLEKVFPNCELAFKRIFWDRSPEGLIISPGPFWFDSTCRENKVTIVNAWAVESAKLMAEIAEYLGKKEKAEYYWRQAESLSEIVRRDCAEGGLWNPETNHFSCWIDRYEEPRDKFSLDSNMGVVAFGIATDEQTQHILQQIEAEKDIIEAMPTRNWLTLYEIGSEARPVAENYENGVAAGRVGLLDFWMRARLHQDFGGQAKRLYELIDKIADKSINTVWLAERYIEGEEGENFVLYVKYYPEYAFVFTYASIYLLYGLQANLDGGITINPCVPFTWYRQGFGLEKLIRKNQKISYTYTVDVVNGTLEIEEEIPLRVKLPPGKTGTWQVYVDEKETNHEILNGMMQFTVPAGKHTFKIATIF